MPGVHFFRFLLTHEAHGVSVAGVPITFRGVNVTRQHAANQGSTGRLARLLSSRLSIALVASALTLLVVGSVALATQQRRATAPINGCYEKSFGRLRVVSNLAFCRANETPLSWSTGGGGGGGASIIAGSAEFVDATTTYGFLGISGAPRLASSTTGSDTPLPGAGTLSSFTLSVEALSGGTVVATVYNSDAATSVTCTITAPATSCVDGSHTAAFGAGDRLSIRIQHFGAGPLRHVRWSALYGA